MKKTLKKNTKIFSKSTAVTSGEKKKHDVLVKSTHKLYIFCTLTQNCTKHSLGTDISTHTNTHMYTKSFLNDIYLFDSFNFWSSTVFQYYFVYSAFNTFEIQIGNRKENVDEWNKCTYYHTYKRIQHDSDNHTFNPTTWCAFSIWLNWKK